MSDSEIVRRGALANRIRLGLSLFLVVGLCVLLRTTIFDVRSPMSSEEIFQQVEVKIAQDRLVEARELLEKCLALDPDHGMARVYLGQLLREEGDLVGARRQWHAVGTQDPEALAMARFLEGTLGIQQGDVAGSRDLLLSSIQLDPSNSEAIAKLVEVWRLLRRPQEMVTQLKELSKLRPLTLNELVYRTVPNQSWYSAEETIDTLQTALESHPHDLHLHRGLLEAFRERHEPEKVKRHLEQLPDELRQKLIVQEILTAIDLGHFDDAFEQSHLIELSSSSSFDLLSACAVAAYQVQHWKQAESLLIACVEQDVNNRQLCFLLGTCLKKNHNGTHVAPEVMNAREELARQLLERSVRLDDLERLCLRITRDRNPNSEQVIPLITEIVSVLIDLKRHRDAMEWAQAGLQWAPENGRLLTMLRQSAQHSDQFELPEDRTWTISEPFTLPDTSLSETRPVPTTGDEVALKFVDVHQTARLSFQYFNGQTGVEHLIESMGGGVLVLDYECDGFEDLYFPQGSHIPFDSFNRDYCDQLFRNRSGQNFENTTHQANISAYRYGLGGTAFDFNNDGFDDLFVSNMGVNEFYINNGDGTFSEAGSELGLTEQEMSTSVVAADFNADGYPDLYVANYVSQLKTCPQPDGTYRPCDPASFEGQPDRLYLNDGRGGIRDTSVASGVSLPNGKGLGVITYDLDFDGDMDLYVANDGVPNFLLENVTGPAEKVPVFVERGLVSGTGLDGNGRPQAGMGVTVADFDQDQRPDLLVTNFYLEHNTLYRNEGDLMFSDETHLQGLHQPSLQMLGFGVQSADFDCDGDPDLLVANGHIFRDPTESQPWTMRAQCFINHGRGNFAEVTSFAGDYFAEKSLGRGIATFDWNRDGRLDAIVVHQDRNAAILENQSTCKKAQIALKLVGTNSNRNAIGAVISTMRNDGSLDDQLQTDGNYLSSNTRLRHVLVNKEQNIKIHVKWPSGMKSTHQVFINHTDDIADEWLIIESGQTYQIN